MGETIIKEVTRPKESSEAKLIQGLTPLGKTISSDIEKL